MKRLIPSLFLITVLFNGINHQSAIAKIICPVADFAALPDTAGCHPFTVNFTNLSTGANNYSWNFGDGSPIDTSTADTIVHIYTNTSGSTVLFNSCLIAQNQAGCADTLCKIISVYPDAPSIFFSADQDSGCSPLTVKFTTFVTGSIDTCLYDFGDGDTAIHCGPTHTFISVSDTFYTVAVSGINPWGCLTDTFTTDIFVHPKPVINSFTASLSIGCTPVCVTISGTATGASVYYWDFGDATFDSSTADTTFIHCYTNVTSSPQFYTLNLIVKNNVGCSDTASTTFTVLPDVTAIFFPQPDTFGCHPYTVNFQNFSLGAAAYEWNFGDGTPINNTANPTHTFTNPPCSFDTIYIVKLIATSVFGCKDTAIQQILVHPKPIADFIVDADTGCSPLLVTIGNLSTCYDSLFWVFGDGSISTDTSGTFTHTYTNTSSDTTNYLLQLIAENSYGCRDTSTAQVVVISLLNTSFTITNVSCNGNNDGFAKAVVNGGTLPYSYLWSSLLNDTIALSDSIANLSAGTYFILVTDSIGCIISDSVTITEPLPLVIYVNFIDTVKTGNDGAIDITVSGGTPPYNFSWSNGAANEDIDSLTAGTYIVVVTDSSGCIDSMSIEVPDATGINEINWRNQIKIYPNPTTGKFNLSIQPENNNNFSVYIYDVFGKLIYKKKYIKENNLQINISGKAKGIYFLKVINDKEVSVRKIIYQ